MIVLEIATGGAAGRLYELDRGAHPQVTLGRADTNAVILPDAHLSGQHGQLFYEEDQVIYRDLRSRNGSALQRGEARIPVDESNRFEITVHDGDQLLLGDPEMPVVVKLHIRDISPADSLEERVLASRSLAELPMVAGKVERDPGGALVLYHAFKQLVGRQDLAETLDAVIGATFEILPRATHVAVLLRHDSDAERFVVMTSRDRTSSAGQRHIGATPPPVRSSRALLRRVLRERAAALVADAAEELSGSESIIAGKIRSTLAVPLWHGGEIRGVIQADNRGAAGLFGEHDLEVMMLLGEQAALAIDNARLVGQLRVAEERLRGENRYLKNREERRFASIVGDSPALREVLELLKKVRDTRVTVCIEGETGTGKELIASTVHYQSKRQDKLFIAQNCAALPENLLESELFGHRRGAFTGADHDKKGLFELADGGTLFLDEVGEMSLGLQAKLLRVLQEGTVRPVGGTAEKQVDVRIICATNRDLAVEVEKGRFRADLFYRLRVFPIRLPPLRERQGDIPALCEHFLSRYTQEYRKAVAGFSQAALDALASYAWPGNIRELENEVQRLVIQCDSGQVIDVDALSPQIRRIEGILSRIAPEKGTLEKMMEQVERWILAEALREHNGNKTHTARTLGITREGLHKKLAKLGMN